MVWAGAFGSHTVLAQTGKMKLYKLCLYKPNWIDVGALPLLR